MNHEINFFLLCFMQFGNKTVVHDYFHFDLLKLTVRKEGGKDASIFCIVWLGAGDHTTLLFTVFLE
jgi:hypothetical protein